MTTETGNQIVERAKLTKFGFLTQAELAAIAADPETRLQWILIRCGNGRFTAPAQDVKHFIAIIEEHANVIEQHTGFNVNNNRDYIRDVSIAGGGRR